MDTLQSSAGLVSEHKMFNMFRPLKPGHVYSTMGPDFIFEVSAIHTFQNTKALRHLSISKTRKAQIERGVRKPKTTADPKSCVRLEGQAEKA